MRIYKQHHEHIKGKQYDALWQYPYFRATNYRITIFWGIAFIAEFCLKVYLVFTLSIPQVLILSPIIFNTLTIALIVLTMLYGTSTARKGREMREAAEKRNAPPINPPQRNSMEPT